MDNLIGYISYNVDWASMSADRFGIVSFGEGNIEFAKDVYCVICELFEKYHMNRISWFTYVENPAIRAYRNFIKKHGGKECGYYRQVAKLQDGKITIGIDYRPCIVHIPEQREYFYENRKRKYKVKKSSEDVKAVFHCWNHHSELYDASPMNGGHPGGGGQVSEIFGIVEYEDGTVHEVKPRNIRFVDNLINEFAFPGME